MMLTRMLNTVKYKIMTSIKGMTLLQWCSWVLVICCLIGLFLWPIFLIAFPILIVLFLADNDLSRRVQGENKRIDFSSGVSSNKNRFDEHEEFYDHDKHGR